MIKQKSTNRKTGKSTTTYKKLTPITKSEFNSGSGKMMKTSRPITKGAVTGATTSGTGSLKKRVARPLNKKPLEKIASNKRSK